MVTVHSCTGNSCTAPVRPGCGSPDIHRTNQKQDTPVPGTLQEFSCNDRHVLRDCTGNYSFGASCSFFASMISAFWSSVIHPLATAFSRPVSFNLPARYSFFRRLYILFTSQTCNDEVIHDAAQFFVAGFQCCILILK